MKTRGVPKRPRVLQPNGMKMPSELSDWKLDDAINQLDALVDNAEKVLALRKAARAHAISERDRRLAKRSASGDDARTSPDKPEKIRCD
jgi:hypothetical protein